MGEKDEILLIFEKSDNEKVEFKGLLKTYQVKESKNGNNYANCSIGNKHTSIGCKIWDESVMKVVSSGGVFQLNGETNDWQGQRSVVIRSASLTTEKPEDFMESVLNAEELTGRIVNAIDKMDRSSVYYAITNHMFSERIEEFSMHPAALYMHHSLIGGLALHTFNMLILGYRIRETYKDLYNIIDWDLLASGIILHDLAKIDEISLNKGLIDYSVEGNLLGHIPMGMENISKACTELGIDESQEEVILLKHMILSHHGKLEWGSPKVPLIPEAMLLHQIDVIDSQMDKFSNEFSTMNPGDSKKGYYKPNK